MKELFLQHIAAKSEEAPAQVRIIYREDERDRGQETTVDFAFVLEARQRHDLRWYLEEYLLAPYSEFLSRAQRVEAWLPGVGADLFRAVFSTDEARDLYGSVKNDLDNTRILIDAASPEGISLPWELLRDPAHGEHGELIRNAAAFARGDMARKRQLAPRPDGKTLNVLYVLSRPEGEEDVPFHAVARPLVALMRDNEHVHFEVLRPPTFDVFAKRLRADPGFFHVVHFDGHGFFPDMPSDARGRFLSTPGEQGKVYFEDGPKDGEVLAQALVAGKVPIVLLNACRSGMAHPEAAFPSVGNQLLRGGARGVVAMAYSVYVGTASRYMASLYEGLLNGAELAAAHKEAVLQLRDSPERKTARGPIVFQDWMVPVLFEASPGAVLRKRSATELVRLRPPQEESRAGAEIGMPEPPQYGFIGRDNILLRLERRFQQGYAALLWGMAGIGKTEMAAAFARWLADTGALKGPVFWFSFEKKTTLADVLHEIGRTFQPFLKQKRRIEWEHVTDPAQRRDLVLQLLKAYACCLVFDNFEPVAGFPAGTESEWTDAEQKALRNFIRDLNGSGTKVLVTSRRREPWLALPTAPVELAGLQLHDAEELAYAILRREGLDDPKIKALPRFDDLLKYLGGNPLAIQVILPELATDGTTPEVLQQALQVGEAKMTSDDATLGRNRSLAASLAYRLDRMDPALLNRLSVLGLFTVCVNTTMLGLMAMPLVGLLSVADMRDITAGANLQRLKSQSDIVPTALKGRYADAWRADLDRAAEVGLLRDIGEGTYTIHPALPWFFHDAFHEQHGAERDAFERVFAWTYALYISYLSRNTYGTPRAVAQSLKRLEEGNLQRACTAALKHDDLRTAAKITYFLGNIHSELRDFDEAEKWYRQALEIDQRLEDEQGIGSTLHNLGAIAQVRHDFDEAEKWYRQALSVWEKFGEVREKATTLRTLGALALERRDFDEAERWHYQSLEIDRHLGDEQGISSTLHSLGNIAQVRRDFDEAEKWYRQALEIEQRLGDEHGISSTLHNLGNIALERNDFDEAEKRYYQSLEIGRRLGDEQGISSTSYQLGDIALERRNFDEAEKWYRQVLEIEQRLGDEHGIGKTLYQLGNIAQVRHDFDEAEKWYRQALSMMQHLKDQNIMGTILLRLAQLAEARGDATARLGFLQQAEISFHAGNDPQRAELVQQVIAHVTAGGTIKECAGE
jgi:tetratricopeptide (TPR) repeat protein